VLADGTVLDTGDAASRAVFAVSNPTLVRGLAALGDAVRTNEPLAARIRRKFKMKNTTGYSLNALVDFTDPVDILAHLMIGSEGTLGFISEITYRTVPDYTDKASALILFDNLETACRAVTILKNEPVAAVELADRAALRSVEGKPGLPDSIGGQASTCGARHHRLNHQARYVAGIVARMAVHAPLRSVDSQRPGFLRHVEDVKNPAQLGIE